MNPKTKMVPGFLCLSLTLILLSTVCVQSQDIDQNFCDTEVPTKYDTPPLPSFPADFVVDIESADLDGKSSRVAKLIYSTSAQMIFMDTWIGHNETTINAYPTRDLQMATQRTASSFGTCVANALEGGTIAEMFDITETKNKLALPVQKSFVFASVQRKAQYVGTETVRGIPAKYWQICAYQKVLKVTLSAKVYFSSTKFTMPMKADQSIMLKAEVAMKSAVTQQVTRKRLDYTHIIPSTPKEDQVFMVPKTKWCVQRPMADMPKIPYDFEYEAEQGRLGDIDIEPPEKPRLEFFKQVYMGVTKTFQQNSWTVGDSQVNSYKHKVYHDFKTGKQYNYNVDVGRCAVTPIDIGPDFNRQVPSSTVTMKSPQELLQMNGTSFQYMGEHHDMDRGIDADVYTSMVVSGPENNPTTEVIIWYFASKNWMLNKMSFANYVVWPLRQLSFHNGGPSSHSIFDIIRYTNNPNDDTVINPDFSACFTAERQLHLEMLLMGRYDYIYTQDQNSFRTAFRLAIMTHSPLFSFLRLAQVDAIPTDRYHTVVQFTVNGRPTTIGNTMSLDVEASNAEIYKTLQNAIKAKLFIIHVKNAFGDYNVSAVGLRQRIYLPGTSKGGSSGYGPGTSKGGSSGYGPGAMAGVAFGCLIPCLVIGFLLFKVAFMLRKRAQTGSKDEFPLEQTEA